MDGESTNAFPRGEGGPPERSEEAAGRMRNAGDNLIFHKMQQTYAKVVFSSSIPGNNPNAAEFC